MKNIAEEAKDIAAGKGHNSKTKDIPHISKCVIELAEALRPIEEQETMLRDKKKKLRSEFKIETGMVQADFNHARRLAEMEDELEQNDKMDNLSIAFNALSGGKQLSFFDKGEDKK